MPVQCPACARFLPGDVVEVIGTGVSCPHCGAALTPDMFEEEVGVAARGGRPSPDGSAEGGPSGTGTRTGRPGEGEGPPLPRGDRPPPARRGEDRPGRHAGRGVGDPLAGWDTGGEVVRMRRRGMHRLRTTLPRAPTLAGAVAGAAAGAVLLGLVVRGRHRGLAAAVGAAVGAGAVAAGARTLREGEVIPLAG